MLNVKHSKLLIIAATVTTLVGCGSTGVDYSAIRSTGNSVSAPQGKSLGGGFIEGMTPEQTCIYFYDHYKSRKNDLCKKVGKADFSELTIVNKQITVSPDKNNQIKTIAFFFDKYAKLSMVQAVADDSSDDDDNKNKATRQISSNY
jgi:hypothetical protein